MFGLSSFISRTVAHHRVAAYVTLRAVKEGRITLDTPLVVSANAAAQNPVKMGFGAGTVVTVDNALKMLMVKSANDMAVVLGEGVSGSVENFADQMNSKARRLGMTQSSFVNPNGLSWLMPSLGTVETLPPINAAPPNLRDDMCGGHRKRPATDEDDVVAANMAPDSPYAVFLSSLRPAKTKGALLLHDDNMGEPVLVYTGTKPPAPGAAQAGWGDPAKPKTSEKTANAKLTPGKDTSGKDKDAPTAAGASAAEGASAPKPKPKKPAPKTLPAAAAAAAPASTQQTSQAR